MPGERPWAYPAFERTSAGAGAVKGNTIREQKVLGPVEHLVASGAVQLSVLSHRLVGPWAQIRKTGVVWAEVHTREAHSG
jgi:hypothetical protein